MVFLAVSIPVLARDDKSLFLAGLVSHANNCHCLARAVNHVAAALFTVHRGSVEERLKEFLAVSLNFLQKMCFNCLLFIFAKINLGFCQRLAGHPFPITC